MSIKIGNEEVNAIYINGEFVKTIKIGSSLIYNFNLDNLDFVFLDDFNIGKLDKLGI